jgi:5-methylcytosine-specific restriction endonuclease McrA
MLASRITARKQSGRSGVVVVKTCTLCNKDRPLEDFNKQRRVKDGLQRYCRECQKAKFAEYYAENLDAMRKRGWQRRELHRETLNAQRRVHHQANRDHERLTRKEWERLNPDKKRAQDARYYRRHRERHLAGSQRWVEQNRDRSNGYKKKWRKSNPLKLREIKHRRRARQYGTRIGRISYRAILEREAGICYLCQQPIPAESINFEHVIPLARGGTHTQDNIRIAHEHCNKKKGAKLLAEL